ncbi:MULTISPECIES: PLD nuclease N-terminal domain-containing protein [unclassified Cryobacterium]|uniref:PLD nuclease N-terminal domain-containing protein n=1 Tax=unclassified Cryobacterium TaxID=2649013 RepID=UPI002AB3E1A2|nr:MULTISPECIES: PLD nuclease N-terminal domain-containing protein [unclassified Cryobacterium]MDY7541888.1 PLD nuclease N-terminal domain-containing protein [Cryobacterium sp. 5B3]MEA9998622.1 PLD nuclease N-terminal domain-containing protein [Cryobacterium sp. RTS3]MEB0266063.1 PLD nuclease N-terminal domain-containing protein [Cryobacterium sp. 10I5]MEB0274182.1 PLD nuclease N-terminal domain-containing protein [Cryobacterium sp. 5B3]
MTHTRKKSSKRLARQRAWNDLSPREQTGVLVAGSVQLALAATAWTDLARRPAALVNGPKLLWTVIIGVNFIGPIAYFVGGRRKVPATTPVPVAASEPEAGSVPPVVDEGESGPMPGLA